MRQPHYPESNDKVFGVWDIAARYGKLKLPTRPGHESFGEVGAGTVIDGEP